MEDDYVFILKSFGFIIVSIMIPFNLWILPDMNKKSELLLEEINISNPTTNILDGYVKNDYDNLNWKVIEKIRI